MIIAQTMTVRGMMAVLHVTDGSQCGAGAVARCQRSGNTTEEYTGIAIAAILNFLRRKREIESCN